MLVPILTAAFTITAVNLLWAILKFFLSNPIQAHDHLSIVSLGFTFLPPLAISTVILSKVVLVYLTNRGVGILCENMIIIES